MKKSVTPLLWTLVVIDVVLSLVDAVFPNHLPIPLLIVVSIVVPLAFALFHGAVRYQWSGILIFLVMCLVVSNVLENTSILTGFPFGHYYYTSGLGPKLFLVPLAIGPAYFGPAIWPGCSRRCSSVRCAQREAGSRPLRCPLSLRS